MFDFIGDLISAGASLFQGSKNRDAQADLNAQNIAMQREFAQNGIRWKVADAQAAGLHPLAALGAQTTSFSNNVGGDAGNDFSNAGQSLGRAIQSMMTKQERADSAAKDFARIGLEKGKLENEVLKTELASKNARLAQELGPGMPGNWINMVSGGPRRANGFPVGEKDMEAAESSVPTVRNLPLWGLFNIKTNPNRASAQTLEDEWGEYAGGAAAAGNPVSDVWYTMGQRDWAKDVDALKSMVLSGSGSRVKRFRRGGGSYRPWAD